MGWQADWRTHFSVALHTDYFHIDDLTDSQRCARAMEAWRRLYQVGAGSPSPVYLALPAKPET